MYDSFESLPDEIQSAQYFGRVEAFEGPAAQPSPEDLGKIFHFDDADLDANRAGLLSASQRTRLWRQDMLKILGAAVCLVAGSVYNIGELAGWLPIPTHGRGAFLGIALILLGLVLAVWSAETWLDLTPGSVLVANGYLYYLRRTRTVLSVESLQK